MNKYLINIKALIASSTFSLFSIFNVIKEWKKCCDKTQRLSDLNNELFELQENIIKQKEILVQNEEILNFFKCYYYNIIDFNNNFLNFKSLKTLENLESIILNICILLCVLVIIYSVYNGFFFMLKSYESKITEIESLRETILNLLNDGSYILRELESYCGELSPQGKSALRDFLYYHDMYIIKTKEILTNMELNKVGALWDVNKLEDLIISLNDIKTQIASSVIPELMRVLTAISQTPLT